MMPTTITIANIVTNDHDHNDSNEREHDMNNDREIYCQWIRWTLRQIKNWLLTPRKQVIGYQDELHTANIDVIGLKI